MTLVLVFSLPEMIKLLMQVITRVAACWPVSTGPKDQFETTN